MTGVYPPVHGVRENVGYALDERLPTLAEDLSAAGRRTGGFISAFVLDGRWGIDRGFDHYYDEFKVQDTGMLNMASVQRGGTETIGQAEAWLDEAAGSPFFLWLHLFEPHDPYEAPEPFASRYPKRPYDAEVAYTDTLVGQLREILEGRGLLERTLLIITGDHGEGLGDHGEYFHGFFVYDSTARVPLIVRLPEARLGGRRVEAAVSHVDLRPTILDALGVEAPAALRSRAAAACSRSCWAWTTANAPPTSSPTTRSTTTTGRPCAPSTPASSSSSTRRDRSCTGWRTIRARWRTSCAVHGSRRGSFATVCWG